MTDSPTTITIAAVKDIWNGKLFGIKDEEGNEYKAWKSDFPDIENADTITGFITKGKNKKGYDEVIIKPERKAGKFGDGKSKSSGSKAAFALSYSKDIAVAMIEGGDKPEIDDILNTAQKFLDWLLKNEPN